MDDRGTRTPLEWELVETLRAGDVQLEINTAIGAKGNRMYSYRLGRLVPGGKVLSFLRPRDRVDAIQLLEDLEMWRQADVDEFMKSRNRR